MNYQGHYQVHTQVTRIFILILFAGLFDSCKSNAQRYQNQLRTGENQTLSAYLLKMEEPSSPKTGRNYCNRY
jgi:hypothetical protein